jgi:hypothetical protein
MGVEAGRKYSEDNRLKAEYRLGQIEREETPENYKQNIKEKLRLRVQLKEWGSQAPKDSSAYADYMARNTKGADQQNWEAYSAIRKKAEAEEPEARTQADAAAKEAEDAQRTFDFTTKRVALEKELDSLKSRGFRRAQDELDIREKILAAEIEAAYQKSQGQETPETEAIKGKQEALRTERATVRESEVKTRSDDYRELQIKRLENQGRNEEAISLSDADAFLRHYDENRSKYGKAEAEKLSREQTTEDILASDSGMVASRLAKLGLGGGAGGSDDKQKRIAEMTQKSAELLAEIRDSIKTPPPTPPITDDATEY